MAIWLAIAGSETASRFDQGTRARVGRAEDSDLRVGDRLVDGAWTVSAYHVEVPWDGERWTTTNVSSRPGLLHVYEPGWEDMALEPGRSWAPARHRWSYGLGRPGHLFHVVCTTDDHIEAPPAGLGLPSREERPIGGQAGEPGEPGEATALLPAVTGPVFTPLERAVLLAYYGEFGLLPRPAVLEPASHRQAARRLGRSTDSARKALERINEKIARAPGAPPNAHGRQLSAEIGRWLARRGALDPAL